MFTLDQVKEIKEKLAHVKASLRQALVDLMFIDEIDFVDMESVTLEKVDDIRKKFARVRMIAGEKMNLFLKFLGQFKESSQSNHE